MAHVQVLAEPGMVKSGSRCPVNNHGQVSLGLDRGGRGHNNII